MKKFKNKIFTILSSNLKSYIGLIIWGIITICSLNVYAFNFDIKKDETQIITNKGDILYRDVYKLYLNNSEIMWSPYALGCKTERGTFKGQTYGTVCYAFFHNSCSRRYVYSSGGKASHTINNWSCGYSNAENAVSIYDKLYIIRKGKPPSRNDAKFTSHVKTQTNQYNKKISKYLIATNKIYDVDAFATKAAGCRKAERQNMVECILFNELSCKMLLYTSSGYVKSKKTIDNCGYTFDLSNNSYKLYQSLDITRVGKPPRKRTSFEQIKNDSLVPKENDNSKSDTKNDKTICEGILCRVGEVCRNDECTKCDKSEECTLNSKYSQGFTQICQYGLCRPCVSKNECNNGLVCNFKDGFCVQCSDELFCPNKLACINGKCEYCDNSSQCIGKACIEGLCAQCSKDIECADGLICNKGICSNCLSSNQCGDNKFCKGGKCRVCLDSSNDCANGLACVNGKCGQCLSSTNCPAGYACISGRCSTCKASTDCYYKEDSKEYYRTCIEGICAPCTNNKSCPKNLNCSYTGNCKKKSIFIDIIE